MATGSVHPNAGATSMARTSLMLNMTFPSLFALPSGIRAVCTRCGAGMMKTVPSGNHRASESVAGTTRGKIPIRGNRRQGGSP
jgi:hypothetical protein